MFLPATTHTELEFLLSPDRTKRKEIIYSLFEYEQAFVNCIDLPIKSMFELVKKMIARVSMTLISCHLYQSLRRPDFLKRGKIYALIFQKGFFLKNGKRASVSYIQQCFFRIRRLEDVGALYVG